MTVSGRLLLDGGVLNPVPVAARLRGAAMQPADDGASLPTVTMLEVMRRSLDASQSALARHSLAAYPPDVLISVPVDACHTADFHKAAELIELGRDLAREALDESPLT